MRASDIKNAKRLLQERANLDQLHSYLMTATGAFALQAVTGGAFDAHLFVTDASGLIPVVKRLLEFNGKQLEEIGVVT